MAQVTEKGIEDILFENGKLTEEKRSIVKMESIKTGKQVEDLILERAFATLSDITQARATILGIDFVDPTSKPIPTDVLGKIPEPVARRYALIPFSLDKNTNTLSVAMADPLDLQIVEFIERKSSSKIKPFISTTDLINEAISDQYSQSLTTQVSAALEEVGGMVEAKEEITDLGKVEEIIKEAPVAKIVSTLVEYAMKARASDIHIEAQDDRTRVRYRIDGILQERVVLPRKVHDALVSRIKILSNLNTDYT